MVLTTWLGRGNFGGVLQAYALQVALRSIGVRVITDNARPIVGSSRALGLLKARISRLSRGFAITQGEALRRSQVELDRFVREKIDTRPLYGIRRTPRLSDISDVDTFIVGGDQVWRPNPWLDSYFLSFLSEYSNFRRVAYGVSFGTDSFTKQEYDRLASYRSLARRFSSISVREVSGVRLCSELWDVSAQWVADPVLLLPADYYRDIAASQITSSTKPKLLSYVLDASQQKRAIISVLSQDLHLPSISVCPQEVPSTRAFRQNPKQWMRPSMEKWLGEFASSDFVVTDSYHGVILSLLFHKPFVAFGNSQRGMSRFESLLGHVGLSSRLVTDRSELSLPLADIDWPTVQNSLDQLIKRGWTFLRHSLNVTN